MTVFSATASADHPDADAVTAVLHAPERLAEVARLGLATAGDDSVLRDVVRAAAERCAAPTALVNIVFDEAAGVLAAHGFTGWAHDAAGVPIEWSICRHTVAQGGVVAVGDTTRDARTRDNPLVAVEGMRAYAGAPLVTSRGQAVGALCVAGPEPRTFAVDELAALRRLADHVVRHLERRAAGAGA